MAITNDLLVKLCPDNSAPAGAKTYTPINMKRRNERVVGGKPASLDIRRAGTTGTVAVYGVDLANPWRANAAPANAAFQGPSLQANTQVFRGDGSTLVFNSGLTYAAFSNYNWLIDLHQFDRYPADLAMWTVSNVGGLATITWTTDSFTGDGTTTSFTGVADYLAYAPGITSPPSSPGGYIVPIVKVAGVLKTLGTDYTIANNNGLLQIVFTAAPANLAAITVAYAPVSGMEFGLHFVAPVTVLAAAAGPFFLNEIRTYDRMWCALTAAPSATSVAVRLAT